MTGPTVAAPTAPPRVFLHIGAPKTGTTYLQQVLFRNRDSLAADGVLYPVEAIGEGFRAAHDFCGTTWFGHGAERFQGAWDAVVERVAGWSGPTVLISSELLAGAPRKRIRKRLAELQPAELHVVFTARDLARQLVSDWQEHIKHKHTVPLETFVDDLVARGIDAPEPFGRLFWGMHDAAYVLDRWSPPVPVHRVHVVTVPPPGGPPTALWTRFCAVVGIDPARYDATGKRSNPSMGVAETELVRRMNAGVGKLDQQSYDALVRLFLAEKVLGGGTQRLTLPPQHHDWVVQRSRRLVEAISAAGYHVEGDLSDLIPGPDPTPYVSPTELSDGDLGPAAIKAATALLRQAGRARAQNRTLRGLDAPATEKKSRLTKRFHR